MTVALYLCVIRYLGQILPGEYGIKRAWNFPCARQHTFSSTHDVTETMLTAEAGDLSDSIELGGHGVVVAEAPPADLDVKVKMHGLRKVYTKSSTSGEDVVAVDHLDLDLYSSQIFCLLGHNGAGKSSVIGMLTGLFDATAGRIEVWCVHRNSIVSRDT